MGIGLLLAFTACGGRMVQEPEVTLDSVRLAGLGLRGGTLLVTLEVTNPNRFTLQASQVSYELEIARPESRPDGGWLHLASGTHAENFSVGPGQTATAEVPVEFTYTDLGTAAATILRAGSFNYRASGSVDVRTPIGTHAVPFTQRGTVAVMGS
jgi:LEA14-like dessication related protein